MKKLTLKRNDGRPILPGKETLSVCMTDDLNELGMMENREIWEVENLSRHWHIFYNINEDDYIGFSFEYDSFKRRMAVPVKATYWTGGEEPEVLFSVDVEEYGDGGITDIERGQWSVVARLVYTGHLEQAALVCQLFGIDSDAIKTHSKNEDLDADESDLWWCFMNMLNNM